jgi:hypothetical membrane protein
MTFTNVRKAGTALFVGVVQFGFFLIVAEALYPKYSVSQNYISDLGATCNPSCTFVQPSSMIFNASIIIMGVLALVSAYFFMKAYATKLLPALIGIAGISMVGVGTFTEATGIFHSIFSLLTFVFIGLSAIAAYKFQRKPMSYFSVMAGVVTLLSLVLYVSQNYLGLGPGGMERMVVYPVLLWAIGFGGHLMAMEEKPMTT